MEKNATVVSLDLETDSLDPFTGRIILNGYRINRMGAVSYVTGDHGRDELYALLKKPDTILSGHGVKFDALFLANNGYSVNCQLEDTRVMAYICWPNEPSHGLKDLVRSRLAGKPTDLSQILFKPLKRDLKYLNPDEYYTIDDKLVRKDLLIEYHREDVLNIDRLRAIMSPPKWFFDVEMPLTRILFEAELYGCPIDRDHLNRINDEFTSKADALIEQLGTDFNPRSPVQVVKKLESLGHDLSKVCSKTDSGTYSVDKSALKQLAWKGDTFSANLLEYRRMSKLLGTYIDPFLRGSKCDGRIHGSFNQAGSEDMYGDGTRGTITGRLSSANPNLQNVSSRTKEGRQVRKAFVATRDWQMFDSDLKQIEPRLVAHFSQSSKLIKAYGNGLDTHAMFAEDIFGSAYTPIQRFIGKTSWLATVYGCWYPKLLTICENFSEDKLELDLTRFIGLFDKLQKKQDKKAWWVDSQEGLIKKYGEEKARELYPKWMFFKEVQDNFIKNNPEIMDWRTQHIARTRYSGYVKTIGGRIIRISGLDSNDRRTKNEAERQAVNFAIQGSAADAIKMITVQFGRKMVDTSLARLFANVHDELLGELKDGKDIALVKDIMENTVKLNNVRIEADTHLINNWSEKK